MTVHPSLLAMFDRVQDSLPRLAREVVDATGHALQSNPRHFPLIEPWTRRRGRFAMEFETELRPRLARLRQGEAESPRFGGLNLSVEGLSLVDEHQALRDVGIAHVVELCNERSRQALFLLNNYFVALKRGNSRDDANPLRPALFARALANALAGADLNAEGHYALVRVAAPGLAAALAPLYTELQQLLEAERLTPLTDAVAAPARRPPRDSQAGLLDSQRGQLADWHERSMEIGSRPQSLQPPAGSTGLLERLYEQILADPQLAAPVKAQLARLQVAVARLSREDSSLLRRSDHPTWRLLNAVSAYCAGLPEQGDGRLQQFLQFLEGETRSVVDSPAPSAAQFEQLLRQVDGFISAQARVRSAPSAAALAQLQREQQRGSIQRTLQQQLQALAAPLAKPAQRFLAGPWTELLTQAMVTQGSDAPLLTQVEALADSLRPRRDRADAATLRNGLPQLVQQIEQGMEAAGWPEARRKALLLELMQLHSQVLRGALRPEPRPRPEPSPEAEAEPDEAQVSRFVEERDSEYASIWASADVNRAELPTQPLPLHEAAVQSQQGQVQDWLDQLPIGGWFHLFVGGGWITAQLVWVGDGRRLFLFVGQQADERHTLTEGALAQLYLNGLAMYLEQEGLLERAVSTLMQDL
jgi:Protein of unknown function (DUF1631)